jgi:hypothetical protein
LLNLISAFFLIILLWIRILDPDIKSGFI